MYIQASLFVFPIVTIIIKCETTSDQPKDFHKNSSTMILDKLKLKTDENRNTVHNNIITSSRTKLTKPFARGFDPYFNKDYFEPFERRPRPVTLVVFRKNGLAPRFVIKNNGDSHISPVAAELQSPYNDVGHFWEDEPRDI